MPAVGAGWPSPRPDDPGMSASEHFNTEFDLLEPDDTFVPFSPLNYLDGSAVDSAQTFDLPLSKQTRHAGLANQVVGGPFANAASPGAGRALAHSPSGSYKDSASDSSSSKRTTSSASEKTPPTSADLMMADEFELWKYEDLVQTEEDMDGPAQPQVATIDPAKILNAREFLGQGGDDEMDFESRANRSNGFLVGPADSPSPDTAGPSQSHTRPSKRHTKAYSQYSLTQSMDGLKASFSRDVSPTSQMVTSHMPSPSAIFNKSPSPGVILDHGNQPPAHNGGVPVQWSPMMDGSFNRAGHPMMAFGQGFQGNAFYPMYPPEPLRFWILPPPLKSRVETQIPIRMVVHPLPPSIRRLHLQSHTIAKPKLLAKPSPPMATADMLELHTMVVCTSSMHKEDSRRKALAKAFEVSFEDPSVEPSDDETNDEDSGEKKPLNGGEVRICLGCITRERKRACRKKNKREEEEQLWDLYQHRRVIVWNAPEIQEWRPYERALQEGQPPLPRPLRPDPVIPAGAMAIEAPLRICCYCRHHGEKHGFQAIFTLKTHTGQLVAQAMSDSIMITDDHKTHAIPLPNPADSEDASPNVPSLDATIAAAAAATDVNGSAFRQVQSVPDLPSLLTTGLPAMAATPFPTNLTPSTTPLSATARNLSRPPSPSTLNGPITKKRKASNTPRVPSTLTMTRMSVSSPVTAQLPAQQSFPTSGSNSPFTPTMNPNFTPEALFGPSMPMAGSMPQPTATGPPTPNSNDQVFFTQANRSTSLENLAMAHQMYSAPTSVNHSRAPSPNGLRNSASTMQHAQLAQAVTQSFYGLNAAAGTVNTVAPTMLKIIPNEGPKSGGIEVTILGRGFFNGLEVMFGDQLATTTTCWGESSIVCLLPPSPVAGPVPVTFKAPVGMVLQQFGKQRLVFKYVDDDEQQLIRSALSILGSKMTGKMEDVGELARRIMGDGSASWASRGQGGSSSGGSGSGSVAGSRFQLNTEANLLKCLDLMDLDDSTHRSRLNLRRRNGQTMLHLACALGLHRFVAGLLARGANPDVRDRGGFTPMHMAAMNNHPELVRRLVGAGADPTIRSLSGLSASDVAVSRDAYRAIRKIERFARSEKHRGGNAMGLVNRRAGFHSRVSSVNSLRSLWEQTPSWTNTTSEFESSDEEDDSSDAEQDYDEEYVAGEEESPTAEQAGDEEQAVAEGDELEDIWLDMRRRTAASSKRNSTRNSISHDAPQFLNRQGSGAMVVNQSAFNPAPAGAAAVPVAAGVQALKDQIAAQIAALQQTMTLQYQNLPGMPPIAMPDPVAYLYTAQLMRRIGAFMPNIGMPGRPGSSGSGSESGAGPDAVASGTPPTPTKELDAGRWWDSFFFSAAQQSVAAAAAAAAAGSTSLPPAYEDIYPEGHKKDAAKSDGKQAVMDTLLPEKAAMTTTVASASTSTRTTTEQGTTTTDTTTTDTTTTDTAVAATSLIQLPSMLRIGRKHAITHEQQENLRRAHAERLKAVNKDKNLWLLWIPLLVGIVLVMTYLRPNTLLKDWTLSGSAQTIRAGTEQMIGEMQRRVTRTFTGAAATNDAGVAPPVAAV